jgi:hypothetical protein
VELISSVEAVPVNAPFTRPAARYMQGNMDAEHFSPIIDDARRLFSFASKVETALSA